MKKLFLLGTMVCALGMMTACKGGGVPVAPTVAAQYAVEDSLDMMEHVLRWSVWADNSFTPHTIKTEARRYQKK